MLEAVELRKSYGGREALKGVSLEARAGELVACIGPNGAGKTTLLTILAGIQRPDAGTMSRGRRSVGWVPQQPALYGKLSVAENLRLFARLDGVADVEATVDADARRRPASRERADEQVARLSGGNRQRVNVAIGLLAAPPVLLLDEPSAALDPRQRERLWEFIGAPRRARHDRRLLDAHRRRRPSATPTACWCSPTASACSGGRRPSWHASAARRARRRLRGRLRLLPSPARPLMRAMRWLLLKDLRILRRSPLHGRGAGRCTRSRSRC